MDIDNQVLSENGRVAKALIESLGELDGIETARLLPPDAQFICRARSESLPIQRRISGREFCNDLQAAMREIFPEGVRHVAKSVIDCGDIVTVESECYGVTTSGKIYNNYFAFIVKFKDSKVVEIREYTDFLHTYEVLFS